ncbi:MAG: acyl-CoA dehydrogenase family protein [Gammaproteobacteria bacterium]|nr:acyl-CoA dehydrogenase family protein [Gammaproteobacteria bacterium]MXY66450.1 acyl-CoA dehydrogenase [Gammaproteobacteria bacterium]MYG67758.1 acyl-CoA dehydrogenase [Gammaproteobacteria bacterium]
MNKPPNNPASRRDVFDHGEPRFTLSREQEALRGKAREFAETFAAPMAAATDRTEEYPWDTVREMVREKFMGMTIPRSLGGLGASYLDAVLVIEEFAKCCGVTGRIMVEGNMGAISAILRYGSDRQKQQACELVLDGDKPAICITEPNAGSAATSMESRAVEEDGHFVVNGKKHWITGGGVSRLHLIFARLAHGDTDVIAGLIAFLDEPGLIIGPREPAMGLRGIPETVIEFDDLRLPQDRLLVDRDGNPIGFAQLMHAYNAQRVGAAAVALGIAQGAFDEARQYVRKREQFGRPIAEFQGLQWMIADMATKLEGCRLMLWKAAASAGTTETGFPDPLLAAQAKLHVSETAVEITNDALQLHGAMGYSRNLPLERMVRDARMFTIGGGTAQMLRNLIAGKVLGIKTPQTRAGYLNLSEKE